MKRKIIFMICFVSLIFFSNPLVSAVATGTPNTDLNWFISSEGYTGTDRLSDSSNFEECPIVLNDYGESTEKCDVWNCGGWSNDQIIDVGAYCTGGWDCSEWNGVTCSKYNCSTWSYTAPDNIKYCSGNWNCTGWDSGGICESWDCTAWDSPTTKFDIYCNGLWNCSDWDATGNVCGNWECTSWQIGDLGVDPDKNDHYCAGSWDCTSWDNGGMCETWNCSLWDFNPTEKVDTYCAGQFDCLSWNNGVCGQWNCTNKNLGGTTTADYYCGNWDCLSWNSSIKVCESWNCTNWNAGAVLEDDYYCKGGYVCSAWESFTYDTQPTLSNFQFIALNSSREQIGTDENAFNFTNLEDIEFMNISFTMTDATGIEGDIRLYFTANGTSACSLGNNQSTTCYNIDSGNWIEFQNGTDTNTFRDIGGCAQGDSIDCSYTGTLTQRNYTCEIDEHYNPNIWKHYPLNFSDINWQSGNNEKIKRDTIWKIELDTSNIPLDADYYKLDFRVNATIGLTPTQPILAYLCNSSYSTGNPETSDYCQLVAGKLPADLQDDGTKFRGIFTKNLTNSLGNIKYVVINSDTKKNNYYSMKTYGFLGSDAVRTSISTNKGASYTNLSDGYETELNINWFYGSASSDSTQILFKIYSNDTIGNDGNSSEQVLTWSIGDLNEPPIVDIIIPEIDSNQTSTLQINWTTAEPNGDTYTTNITLSNSTETIIINSTLSSSISQVFGDSSNYNGIFNLTVESCENSTSDLFCGNDTHEILIDNAAPLVSLIFPDNNSQLSSSQVNIIYTVTDLSEIVNCSLFINDVLNISNSSITKDVNQTFNIIFADGSYSWKVQCEDFVGNLANSSEYNFTIDTAVPLVTLNSPVNYYNTLLNYIDFNWTVVNGLGLLGCNLTIDGVVNATNISCNSGVAENYTVTNIVNGTHNWSVVCWDGLMNAGQSETRNFTILSDTCTPTPGQNWNIDFADNCTLTGSTLDMQGYNLSITSMGGDGSFTTYTNITNCGEIYIKGDSDSHVYCLGGGCFKCF